MMRPVVLILLLATGCATLKVDVRALNTANPVCLPSKAERAALEIAARVGAAKQSAQYAKAQQEINLDGSEAIDRLVRDAEIDPSDAAKFKSNFDRFVGKAFESALARYDEGIAQINSASVVSDPAERAKRFAEAEQQLRAGDAELRALAGDADAAALSGTDRPIEPLVAKASSAAELSSKVNAELHRRGLVSSNGVLDHPLAGALANAPDDCWRGVFNESYGRGLLGNTDIAIKMEDVGNFTVKGVRVDSTAVTQASFKVLSQSVRLVGMAYGLPMGGSSTGSESGDSDAAKEIADADAKGDAVAVNRAQFRETGLALISAVTRESKELEADSSRKAAVKRVQQFVEAYKGRLSLDVGSSPKTSGDKSDKDRPASKAEATEGSKGSQPTESKPTKATTPNP